MTWEIIIKIFFTILAFIPEVSAIVFIFSWLPKVIEGEVGIIRGLLMLYASLMLPLIAGILILHRTWYNTLVLL